MVPRWLAAAALFVLGFGATLGASGYVSLRRAVAEQQARADALEARQRESQRSLSGRARTGGRQRGVAGAASTRGSTSGCGRARARSASSFERQLAAWQERADVRRRADMAQVAASLSYLDGRHGQQLARTNELLGYFLQASDKR